MDYLIPRALHRDSLIKDEPVWDTLCALCNPYSASQWVQLRFFDCDGKEVEGSPLSHLLKPGHSFATTLINHNVFTDPPQNFEGYAKIEFPGTVLNSPMPLPVTVCLGGGGPMPMHWNYSTPNVPVYGEKPPTLVQGKRWVFPYCIPSFVDLKHCQEHEYRAGLSLANLGNETVSVKLTYTVGDFYVNEGHQVSANIAIRAGASVAKQVHELLPDVLQYNSEGWLDIQTDKATVLAGYLLNSNRDYNYLGWGTLPTLIED